MASDELKTEVVDDLEIVELDEESLAGVAGGGLRDDVYITPPTDISDDTCSKI